jgi:hypothetical protein
MNVETWLSYYHLKWYECGYNIIVMSRVKVNKKVSIPIGHRLEELVLHLLEMSWSGFAQKLGYSNPSTLHKIRSGDSLPSVEKLHELALLNFKDKGRVNIDWLLTGQGSPFLDGLRDGDAKTKFAHYKKPQMHCDEKALVSALISILQRSQAD